MSAQPSRQLPPEVIAALQRGNLIEAIKLLRASGRSIDLKPAKQAIEQHLDRSKAAKATVGGAIDHVFQIPAVADAIKKGNKIEAIRILREKTGLGLNEAKDVVDRFRGQSMGNERAPEPPKIEQKLSRPGLAPGEVPPTTGGGQFWLIVSIIVGALIYYVLYRFWS